jgi:hypothetical protein
MLRARAWPTFSSASKPMNRSPSKKVTLTCAQAVPNLAKLPAAEADSHRLECDAAERRAVLREELSTSPYRRNLQQWWRWWSTLAPGAHTRRRTAVGRLSSPGVLALKTWLRRSRTIHTRRCVPIYPHRLLGIAMSLFWEHSTEGLLRADRGKVKGRPRTPGGGIGVGLR